ncbi:exported hypothetical protein [Gammaproteobacteria bacterium]
MQYKHYHNNALVVFLSILLFFFQSSFADNHIKSTSEKAQLVYFRDLIVRCPNCYGESDGHISAYAYPEKERLIDYIQFLFSLVNEEHKASYYAIAPNGKQHLQEGKENHVTRLAMNEFSLYTYYLLSIDDFNGILTKISEMAEHLEPNVQALLSSFAVEVEGKVLNTCVFVEGGNIPKLHVFAKNTASITDIEYFDRCLFSQSDNNADGTITPTGLFINTAGVFEVKIAGGTSYLQLIDICMDHKYSHSIQVMERRFFDGSKRNVTFPERIEQCVTSNSIHLNNFDIAATVVLHADSKRSMYPKHPLDILHISQDNIEQVVPSTKYNLMSINKFYDGYQIENLPFGPDVMLEVLPERPIAEFIPPHLRKPPILLYILQLFSW